MPVFFVCFFLLLNILPFRSELKGSVTHLQGFRSGSTGLKKKRDLSLIPYLSQILEYNHNNDASYHDDEQNHCGFARNTLSPTKSLMVIFPFQVKSVALPHDLRTRFRSRTNPEKFQRMREIDLIFFRVERGFIIINQRTSAAISFSRCRMKGRRSYLKLCCHFILSLFFIL